MFGPGLPEMAFTIVSNKKKYFVYECKVTDISMSSSWMANGRPRVVETTLREHIRAIYLWETRQRVLTDPSCIVKRIVASVFPQSPLVVPRMSRLSGGRCPEQF